MRAKIIALPTLAFLMSMTALAQNERGSAEITVNDTTLRIEYGRPALNNREVLPMADVGTGWRLGADQATEIETSGDLLVAGKTLKAGRYSLWAKKTGATDWVLAFHPKTEVWGAPALRDGFVAELPLALEEAAESEELVTIDLHSHETGRAEIHIKWGKAILSGDFGVN